MLSEPQAALLGIIFQLLTLKIVDIHLLDPPDIKRKERRIKMPITRGNLNL